MIDPDTHDRLMNTDINYVKNTMQNEIDRFKAALYASVDSPGEDMTHYLDKVVDKDFCGSTLPIKKEFRWWEAGFYKNEEGNELA